VERRRGDLAATTLNAAGRSRNGSRSGFRFPFAAESSRRCIVRVHARNWRIMSVDLTEESKPSNWGMVPAMRHSIGGIFPARIMY
jgi:hypothetical protein